MDMDMDMDTKMILHKRKCYLDLKTLPKPNLWRSIYFRICPMMICSMRVWCVNYGRNTVWMMNCGNFNDIDNVIDIDVDWNDE